MCDIRRHIKSHIFTKKLANEFDGDFKKKKPFEPLEPLPLDVERERERGREREEEIEGDRQREKERENT